jgi:hypothetical protein
MCSGSNGGMDAAERPVRDDTEPDLSIDLDGLLAVEVGGLCDEALRRHVVALHRAKAILDAATVEATRALDARKVWATDAARSPGAWLAARCDVLPGAARHDVEVGRTLAHTPLVAAAARAGRLGRVKVDALVAVRTPEVADLFAAHEAWLVDKVAGLRADQARRFCEAWLQQARLQVGWCDPDGPAPADAPRIAVDLTATFAGRFVLDGEMDAEHGALVSGALDAEVDAMFRCGLFAADDGLSVAERRGLAFAQILARKARAGTKNGEPRPAVDVVVDARTLAAVPIDDAEDLRSRVCRTRTGHPLSPQTARRLACNALLRRVLVADGAVLDLGMAVRLATGHQKRALTAVHGGCQFPGCTAPVDWCEAHHLDPHDPAAGTGPTDMANLALLCRFHHHRIHDDGYTLARAPDGGLAATRPDGTPIHPCRPRAGPARAGPPDAGTGGETRAA